MSAKSTKGSHPSKGKSPRKLEQKTFRMGEAQNFRWDKALATAEAIEDEELIWRFALNESPKRRK